MLFYSIFEPRRKASSAYSPGMEPPFRLPLPVTVNAQSGSRAATGLALGKSLPRAERRPSPPTTPLSRLTKVWTGKPKSMLLRSQAGCPDSSPQSPPSMPRPPGRTTGSGSISLPPDSITHRRFSKSGLPAASQFRSLAMGASDHVRLPTAASFTTSTGCHSTWVEEGG